MMNTRPVSSHPEVIAIDLPDGVAEHLRALGFNAVSGTYGGIYHNDPQHSRYKRLRLSHSLPNFAEREIVILDSSPPKHVVATATHVDYWRPTGGKWVNPAPRSMLLCRPDADRILQHGGIFVVLEARSHQLNTTIKLEMPRRWTIGSFCLDNIGLRLSRTKGEKYPQLAPLR
jgi:hypothetical protein